MLTKPRLALLVSAPLVAGAATYAAAQGTAAPGDAPHKELVQKFDQNGDGTLDDAERARMKAAFAARRAEHRKEMLATYDTNHDGALDQAERQAMRDARLTRRFQAMDANGDGQISLDEFKAGARAAHHRHGRRGHGVRHRASATP